MPVSEMYSLTLIGSPIVQIYKIVTYIFVNKW